MTRSFQEQWVEYISLYWSKVYSMIDTTNIFPKDSIVLWGWVSYEDYEKSDLFVHTPIYVNNKNLNVYYYARRIVSGHLKFFAFVNTICFKELVLNLVKIDTDHLFIKRLYESGLSIHSIFDHKYQKNCWMSMNKIDG